jgi:diguanylate cyclase (GGDEF)-like protein
LTTRDGLTQLFNRRRFDEALAEEVLRARRELHWLSVILLDLDFFKAYNDHHGHLAGDECLKRVARTLQHAVRRPGDMAARFGGEEFLVLLPGTDPAAALAIAEEVRQRVLALALPHGHSDAAAVVSLSAGVASLKPTAAGDAQRLVDQADQALYRAKSGGRNLSLAYRPSNPSPALSEPA